jgi:hypothetical protein
MYKKMSRGRRNNKNNNGLNKILKLVPILCVIAVIALFYMIFDMRKKIDESYYNVDIAENNETTNQTSYTNVLEDITNDDEDINEEKEYNSSSNTTSTDLSNLDIVTSTDKTNDTTDKKLQAEQIVEKEWGYDDEVTFDCYVNNVGEYIVSVTDIASGKVLVYYLVDLDTEEIVIY